MKPGNVPPQCSKPLIGTGTRIDLFDVQLCPWPAGHPPHVDCHEFIRASGQCTCETCGKLYIDHPYEESIKSGIDGHPFLNRLCDGTLVKL